MEKRKIQPYHIEKMKSFGIILEDYSEVELFKYKKGEAIIREGFPMEHLFLYNQVRRKYLPVLIMAGIYCLDITLKVESSET